MQLTKRTKNNWRGTALTGSTHWVRVYRTRMALGREQCRRCGHTGTPRNPLTLDHLKPLCDGGSSSMDNATILCRRDNTAKDDERLPLLSLAAEEARAPEEQRWSTLPLSVNDAAAVLWFEWAGQGQCPSCELSDRVIHARDMVNSATSPNATAKWLQTRNRAEYIMGVLGVCRCASAATVLQGGRSDVS